MTRGKPYHACDRLELRETLSRYEHPAVQISVSRTVEPTEKPLMQYGGLDCNGDFVVDSETEINLSPRKKATLVRALRTEGALFIGVLENISLLYRGKIIFQGDPRLLVEPYQRRLFIKS